MTFVIFSLLCFIVSSLLAGGGLRVLRTHRRCWQKRWKRRERPGYRPCCRGGIRHPWGRGHQQQSSLRTHAFAVSALEIKAVHTNENNLLELLTNKAHVGKHLDNLPRFAKNNATDAKREKQGIWQFESFQSFSPPLINFQITTSISPHALSVTALKTSHLTRFDRRLKMTTL